MKRFYKNVTIDEADGGFEIHLDGKPVRSVARTLIVVPTEKLAHAIAAEWQAQGEKIDPETMPLMQILTTALDRVVSNRVEIEAQVLAYLNTDLLCYRIDQPDDLVAAQSAAWNPGLAWFEKTYGMALETTRDLTALVQPDAAHKAVQADITALDDFHFTALQILTAASGSLVLALEFVKSAMTPAALFDTVYVDENYKAKLYNEALHGGAPHEEKSQALMKRDFEATRVFLDSL